MEKRADSYAKLEFSNTHHLVFRDLSPIIAERVRGNKAVDFGYGAGRSTKFLARLWFEVVGIDIS